MKYCPEQHTPAARKRQLADIFDRYPQAYLVGSVGRAAILGLNLSTSKGTLRQQVRDIDIMLTNGKSMYLTEEDAQPFPVDSTLEQLVQVSETQSYATVLFNPHRKDIYVELPMAAFEPYPTKFGSVVMKTFHPDTLRRLHLIRNSKRPKDMQSISKFEQALAITDYPRLPEGYFEPLNELQQMVAEDPELSREHHHERILALYGTIPESIRAVMRPIARPLRKAVGVASRDDENLPQAPPLAQ